MFGSGATGVFASLQTLVNALQSGSASDIGTATEQLRTAFDGVNTLACFLWQYSERPDRARKFSRPGKSEPASQRESIGGGGPDQSRSDMSQASMAQQAALEAIAKAQSLSLLNYLPQD